MILGQILLHLLLNGLDTIIIYLLFPMCLQLRPLMQGRSRYTIFLLIWLIQSNNTLQSMHHIYCGMLGSAITTLFFSCLLFENHIKECLFVTLLFHTFLFISEVMAYGLFHSLGITPAPSQFTAMLVLLSLSSRIINTCMITGFCMAWQRYRLYNIKSEQGWQKAILLFPVPLLICLVTLRYSPYAQKTNEPLFWICFGSLLLSFWYVLLLLKEIVERQRLTAFEQISDALYKGLADEQDKLARNVHDFRHHLNIMKITANQTYVREVENQIPTRKMETGNYMIDGLIQNFKKQYPAICIKTNGKLPKIIAGIQPSHLVALFSNMLENAVSAVLILEGAKDVQIDIDYDGYSLFIQMKNAYIKGQTKTSGQGIGLKNIQSVTDDYDGKLIIETRDGIFIVKVLLQTQVLKGGESI